MTTTVGDEDMVEVFDARARVRAWAVHAFTASGAVLGFLALISIMEGDVTAVFLWLGLALAVDGIDGTLARRARVSEVIPQFDGATLDNVIDYFNYVAVPAMMIYWFGLVPEGWATVAAATIMGVSCYTFANTGVKSHDYYFVGFPALWNLLVLYFHILQSDPWINLAVLAVCAVLTFVPLAYVHPFRVRQLRRTSLSVTALWSVTSLILVLAEPRGREVAEALPLVFWAWIGCSVYFAAVSLWRSWRGRGRGRARG